LDLDGRPLPNRHEMWVIRDVARIGVRLEQDKPLGLTVLLGLDVIHRFDTDASRSVAGGTQYGHLLLGQQMFIQNDVITYKPCPRPGERVEPAPVTIVDLLVESEFPEASGMGPRLRAAGYSLHWVRPERVPSIELNGGQLVIEHHNGRPTQFHTGSGRNLQVLVKKQL
jgi:hypothetical protein